MRNMGTIVCTLLHIAKHRSVSQVPNNDPEMDMDVLQLKFLRLLFCFLTSILP